MASILTLLSRYLTKKKKFNEKQQIKTEKIKKQKLKQQAELRPDHSQKLKAWEKTYGAKKQKKDDVFNKERKKRVLKARRMGPEERQKVKRYTSVYMVKDPFTKTKNTSKKSKSHQKALSKKQKKAHNQVVQLYSPIKESIMSRFSSDRFGLDKNLVDSVREVLRTSNTDIGKPLDLSLKPVNNIRPETKTVKEDVVMEGAKKMKLTPGAKLSNKDFQAKKAAIKAAFAARKQRAAAPTKTAPAIKKVSTDDEEGMLGNILKGKLPAGQFHAGTVRGAIMSFSKPSEKADFQKKLWKAKSTDEVHELLKSRS